MAQVGRGLARLMAEHHRLRARSPRVEATSEREETTSRQLTVSQVPSTSTRTTHRPPKDVRLFQRFSATTFSRRGERSLGNW
jgi:hypothetical protein